jgi:Proteasome subunit
VHRLFQVEYAIEAVKLGSTAVGIQTTEGVVLAVEKRLTSILLEPTSVEKILEIDCHIGAAVSGLIGGSRFCFGMSCNGGLNIETITVSPSSCNYRCADINRPRSDRGAESPFYIRRGRI